MGLMVAIDVLALLSVMVTLEDAGAGSDTLKGTGVPRATVTGTVWIGPSLCTVTVAVVAAILGDSLAVMVVVPKARPGAVTGTLTDVEPCGMVTVGSTVATLVLLELRLITKP
ncbi:MAG: hypothetical protein ABSH09_27290, partial [Bryobacteraceae bacterium]